MEDETECYFCIDCAKDYKLKKFILQNTIIKGKCHFCGEENSQCIDILDNHDFFNFMRALTRYHYWEDEYNHHFGGFSLHELLIEENNFILNNHRFKEDILCTDNIICGMQDYQLFGKDTNVVELYYGHIDGMRLSWGERIKDKKSYEIEELEKELLEKNYFLLEENFLKELRNYESLFSSYIEKDSKFFRARIGYKEEYEKKPIDFDYTNPNSKKGYIPYKDKDIGAPPLIYTNQGRLNRNNVSFLYLATDIPTTIAEVRPHPGHKISIGCFYAKENIKVVDFDKAFIQLSQNEESLEKFIFLNHIDRLLSMPLTPEERTMYLITQFFSDIFRKLGFDGVMFSSSVGDGQNVLIYNPNLFQYTEESSSVYQVEKLEYTIKEI